jgi:hypothetical protein
MMKDDFGLIKPGSRGRRFSDGKHITHQPIPGQGESVPPSVMIFAESGIYTGGEGPVR